MVHTYPHSLSGLALDAGPFAAVHLRAEAPVQLQVRFVHERGYPDLPTLPNGDPGEPGRPEYFDFQSIVTTHPVVLTEPDGMRTLIPVDYDMHKLLNDKELAAIELALLAKVRAEEDDARAEQRLNILLEGLA